MRPIDSARGSSQSILTWGDLALFSGALVLVAIVVGFGVEFAIRHIVALAGGVS